MTNNLKIEVLVSNIPEDGSIASQFPSQEYVNQQLAKKASLSPEGRLDPSHAPDYTEIPGLYEHIEDTKDAIETSIADSLQDAKGYTNQQLSTSLQTKADLVNGKIPFDQIPFSADIEEQIQINVENITAVVDQKVAQVVEQVNGVATAANSYTDTKVAETKTYVDTTIGNVIEDVERLGVSKAVTIPTYLTPEAGVAVGTGVAAGAYYNVRSTEDDTVLVEYQNVGGVPTPSGKSYPSSVAVRNIAKYTALPFIAGKTYGLHERVQLENGDIVKSTIDGNSNDPNVSMTWWENKNVTTVEYITDLANLDVWDGRAVLVLYSDTVYVYSSSLSSTNDGGYIVNGWVAQIKDNTITPAMFGAFPDSTRDEYGTDYSTELNKMFKVAITNGFEVQSQSSLKGREKAYYITKPIIATGIHTIKGTFILHAKSSVFDTSTTSYMLCLGDPNTTYTTIQSILNYDIIWVRDLDKRASAMQGVFLKYTAVDGGTIRAFDMNGRGIHGSPVYDSVFTSLVTERCGNTSQYALQFDGNGDESNAITFHNLLVHDSYHKGLFIAGSKHTLVRAHLEANSVLTSNDGFSTSNQLGLTYVNHLIHLVSGCIGHININDYDNADGKTYFDDQTQLNATNPPHLYLKLERCGSGGNIFNLTSSKSNTAVTNIGITTVDTGNTYSEINTLYCGTFNGTVNTRVTIQNVNINVYVSPTPAVIIKGGVINSWGNRHIGTFYDTRFNSSAFGDNSSYVIAKSCNFNAGITKLTASPLNKFTDCNIPSLVLSSESQAEVGTFYDCQIGTNGVSSFVTNGASGYMKNLTFKGCTLRGTWPLDSGLYNITRFVGTENTSSGAAITGAKQEYHTAIGTICQNMNTMNATGDALLYIRTANNSDGSGTYQPISTKT